MNTSAIEQTYYDYTHGLKGFLLVYLLVVFFSIAGLKRARAGFDHYIRLPFTSLATLVVGAFLLEAIFWAVRSFAGVTGACQWV